MTPREAFYVWFGLNLIFLALSMMLLLEKSGLGKSGALAAAGLMLLYPPVGWHFVASQSKLEILLLLVLMMGLFERGWDRAAGICLGLAGLLRVFPLLLVGYLFLQHRWRCMIWTFLAVAAGAFATVWLVGLQIALSFPSAIEPFTQQHWLSFPANVGIGAAVSRFFWIIWGTNLSAGMDLVRRIAVLSAGGLVLGTTVRATLRFAPGQDPDWRAFAMWIVASVLLTPTALAFYMVLFLVPFAQIVAAAADSSANARTGRVSERTQWAAILSYVVIILASLLLEPTREIALWHAHNRLIQWSMRALGEGWFASAMLAYLATYWFTVDGRQAGG
jgi:hypothetical protein